MEDATNMRIVLDMRRVLGSLQVILGMTGGRAYYVSNGDEVLRESRKLPSIGKGPSELSRRVNFPGDVSFVPIITYTCLILILDSSLFLFRRNRNSLKLGEK